MRLLPFFVCFLAVSQQERWPSQRHRVCCSRDGFDRSCLSFRRSTSLPATSLSRASNWRSLHRFWSRNANFASADVRD
ncbi:hypothetical protein M758_7G150900 [Ceratodon purpureus]|nr:hypothetical protein M758_7G150900 [Ceratodon purpureus]